MSEEPTDFSEELEVADASPAEDASKDAAEPARPSARQLRWVARGLLVLAGLALFSLGWALAPRGTPAPVTETPGEWTCAMHPDVRLPEPGLCPVCAMELIEADARATRARPDRIQLTERAMVLAGLRTTPVSAAPAEGTALRLLGRVDYDETTLATVTTWVGGRLDRLHVQTTGARVRRGQTVASVYSPEVHAAAHDLAVARRQLEQLAESSPLAQTAARSTLAAAEARLTLLGVPEPEVARMGESDRPPRRVAVRSPFSGTVVERLASEGETVPAGAALYRVANLRRVWVQLDAFEADLARLSIGQAVSLRLEALPGESFEGRVAFIDPVLDIIRRTARVRVEVDNTDGRLRPGMNAQAELGRVADHGRTAAATIPASAPLFTGTRSLVYVELNGAERPTYEAREVRLGGRVGDVYPVLAGLRAGERVVVHGAFVLDADQQLSGHASMMNGGVHGLAPGAITLPASALAELRPSVSLVLEMATHLAADNFAASHANAVQLIEALDAVALSEPADAAEAYRPLAASLRQDAERARDAESIDSLRVALEPLVASTSALLARFGNPMPEPVHVAHCPMAFDGRGASWLQTAELVDNAYFGAAMRSCGTIRQTVAPAAHLTELRR